MRYNSFDEKETKPPKVLLDKESTIKYYNEQLELKKEKSKKEKIIFKKGQINLKPNPNELGEAMSGINHFFESKTKSSTGKTNLV